MSFNVDKCKVLHFGHNNQKHMYFMNDLPLEAVESEKDLGIIIHESCKPSQQCVIAAKKANSILGQMNKAFNFKDQKTCVKLFINFVRPHIEYAIQAWCPWNEHDINLLESVQKRAIKMIPGLRGSYEDKLKTLKLLSLRDRRIRGDAIETYTTHIKKKDAASF